MTSFFSDNDDLQYYLREGIDWETVASTTEFGYTSEGGFKSTEEALAFYRDVAATVGEFVSVSFRTGIVIDGYDFFVR